MGAINNPNIIQSRQISQMFSPCLNSRPVAFMSQNRVGLGTTIKSLSLGVSEFLPLNIQKAFSLDSKIASLKRSRGFELETSLLKQMSTNYKINSGLSEDTSLAKAFLKNNSGLIGGLCGLSLAATAGIGTFAYTGSLIGGALATMATTVGIGTFAQHGIKDKTFYEKSSTAQYLRSIAKGATLAAGLIAYFFLTEVIRDSVGFSPIPWATGINSIQNKFPLFLGILIAPVVAGTIWGIISSVNDINKNADYLLPFSKRNIYVTNVLSRTSILFSLAFLGYRALSVAATIFLTFGGGISSIMALIGTGLLAGSCLLLFKGISQYKNIGLNNLHNGEVKPNKKGHSFIRSAAYLGLSAALISSLSGVSLLTLASLPLMLAMLVVDFHTILHSVGYNFAQCRTLSKPDNYPETDEIFRAKHDMSKDKSTVVVKPLLRWAEGGDSFSLMILINRNVGIRKFVFQVGAYPLKIDDKNGCFVGDINSQKEILLAEVNVANIRRKMKTAYDSLSPNEYKNYKNLDNISQEDLRKAQKVFANKLYNLCEILRRELNKPKSLDRKQIEETFSKFGVDLNDEMLSHFFDKNDGENYSIKTNIAEIVDERLKNKSISNDLVLALHACYQLSLGEKKERVKNDALLARIDEIHNEAKILEKEANNPNIQINAEQLFNRWKYYLDIYSIDVITVSQRNDYYATRRISKADCQDWHRTNYGNNMTEVLIEPISNDGRILPPAYAVLPSTYVYVENPMWDHGMPEENSENPELSRYILVPREDLPWLNREEKSTSHAPDLAFVDNRYLWKGFRYDAKNKTFTKSENVEIPAGPRILFKSGAYFDAESGKYFDKDNKEIKSPSLKDGIQCKILFVPGQNNLPSLFKLDNSFENHQLDMLKKVLEKIYQLKGKSINGDHFNIIGDLNEILLNDNLFTLFEKELESNSDYKKIREMADRLKTLEGSNSSSQEILFVRSNLNRMIIESLFPSIPKSELLSISNKPENLYYLKRLPLNWQYDYYDYETNIDSEFLDLGTTSAGNAIIEKDKNRPVVNLAYSIGRRFYLPLDVIMSDNNEISPFENVTMFRNIMYMKMKTKDGKTVIIPISSFDNKPALPLVQTDLKSPPKTKKELFANFLANSNNISKINVDHDNGKITISLKPDSFNKSGINSIEIKIKVSPQLIRGFYPEKSKGYKNMMENAINELAIRLKDIPDSEEIVESAIIKFDWRTINKLSIEKAEDNTSRLIAHYDLTKFGYGEKTAVILKSRYLPINGNNIEIDLENFDKCVGEKPFVGYEYRFKTFEEAKNFLEKHNLYEIIPIMQDYQNKEKPFYFYTFAFVGSDFKVRDFDAETINKKDLEIVETSNGPQLFVRAKRHKKLRVPLHNLSTWLNRSEIENNEISFTNIVSQNNKLLLSFKLGKKTILIDPKTYIPENAYYANIEKDEKNTIYLRFFNKRGEFISTIVAPKDFSLLDLQNIEKINVIRLKADSRYGFYNSSNQFVPLPIVPSGKVEFEKKDNYGELVYKDKKGREIYRIICPDVNYPLGELMIKRKANYILFSEKEDGVNSIALEEIPCEASNVIDVSKTDGNAVEVTELLRRVTFTSNFLNGQISKDDFKTITQDDETINSIIEDLLFSGYLEKTEEPNKYLITNYFMELRSGEKMSLSPKNLKFKQQIFDIVKEKSNVFYDPQNAEIKIKKIDDKTIDFEINTSYNKKFNFSIPIEKAVDNNGAPLTKFLPKKSVEEIYFGKEKDEWGDNYAPKLLIKHGKLFIRISVVKKHKVNLEENDLQKIKNGSRLSIAKNDSMIMIQKGNGQTAWVTTKEKILGIDNLDIDRSGISNGKIGITIFPQHAVSEDDENYGVFDQKTFYGEFWHGPQDPTRAYFYGYVPSEKFRRKYIGSGGNIQAYRSLTGSAINSGTPVHRDMRAAQENYGKWEKELEYHEGKFLHLNEFSNIVEDYFESRGILKDAGYDSIFSPEIVGVGWAPDKIKQLVEQRLRWMSSIGIGPRRIIPNLYDDLRARIGRAFGKYDRPQFYSLEGISQEFAGCTWYWAGPLGIIRALAPTFRFLGIVSYPADPIIFPALVLGTITTGLPSYLLSMKKIGEKIKSALFKAPAIFGYLRIGLAENASPAINLKGQHKIQSVSRIIDIGDGPFTITSEVGGLLPERFMNRHKALVVAQLAAGLVGTISMIRDGLTNPQEIANNLATFFDYVMNIFWPFWNTGIDTYGIKLINDSQNPNKSLKNPIYFDENLKPKE